MNELGYFFLSANQIQDAIAVFQRNVLEYPQCSNVYDSLGEAYMKTGQIDLSITNCLVTTVIFLDAWKEHFILI